MAIRTANTAAGIVICSAASERVMKKMTTEQFNAEKDWQICMIILREMFAHGIIEKREFDKASVNLRGKLNPVLADLYR